MRHIDLSELAPRDVIDPNHFEEYEQGIEFFHNQLYFLNTDLYIVEKIVRFPFKMFVGPEMTVFFTRVVDNTLDATVLRISRMIVDTGEDDLNLHNFKSKMILK